MAGRLFAAGEFRRDISVPGERSKNKFAKNLKKMLTRWVSPLNYQIFLLEMKTTIAKKEDQQRQWYVVDAKDLVLGRLAVKIANVLRGRHKPIYTPHVDCGDHVVVINADKVKVTGKKENNKEYMFYSGYVGGEKYVKLSDFRARKPEFLIMNAVKGMLPGNKLAYSMLTKLHVYAGDKHPHEAQQPKPFNF